MFEDTPTVRNGCSKFLIDLGYMAIPSIPPYTALIQISGNFLIGPARSSPQISPKNRHFGGHRFGMNVV